LLVLGHTIYVKGTSNAVTGVLWELTDYVVDFGSGLTDARRKLIIQNYGAVLQPLHGSYFLLNYGNFVGYTFFCGREYKVLSRKLTERDIERMNRLISSKLATLPYDVYQPAQTSWTVSAAEEAQKLHQWYLLRTAMLGEWEGAPLSDWWRLIDRDPHHRIESIPVDSPDWTRLHIEPESLEAMIGRPETWVPLPAGSELMHTAVGRKLSAGGRSYFPSEVRGRVNQLTYDTADNRMLKNIVEQFQELTEWMDNQLQKGVLFNRYRLNQDNQAMNEELGELLRSAWIQEVGALTVVPQASTVLQRKNGYRQWYSLYQQWLLGGQFPLPNEWLRILVDTKDIAKIYEFWCFFTVVDLIEQQIGVPPNAINETAGWDELGKLVNGLRVDFTCWENPLQVYYNKCFSGGKESYSLTYRPDISVRWQESWHHFDAKFKAGSDGQGGKAVKKEDLDKMHTYRDAIQGTNTVWVLYPGDHEKTPLFYQAGVDAALSGVGAVALTPNHDAGLRAVIARLLESYC